MVVGACRSHYGPLRTISQLGCSPAVSKWFFSISPYIVRASPFLVTASVRYSIPVSSVCRDLLPGIPF